LAAYVEKHQNLRSRKDQFGSGDRKGKMSKGGRKNMQKRQSDKTTKQIRINTEIHRKLKIQAAKEGKTLKSLLDELLEQIEKELFVN